MDSYVIKVTHKCGIHAQTIHRLTLGPDEPRFSYEKLQYRIRDVLDIPSAFQFILIYQDANYDLVSMSKDTELEDALVSQSLRPLRVNVEMDYAKEMQCSIGRNLASYVVELIMGKTSYLVTVVPGQPEFSFEQFQSRICSIFKLPPSARVVLTYKYSNYYKDLDDNYNYRRSNDFITIADIEQLKDAIFIGSQLLSLYVGVAEGDSSPNVHGASTYFVKVKLHNGICRRLTLPLGMLEFSYEQLESAIRELFKLHLSSQLDLSYNDEVGDDITLTKGQDVKDVLVKLILKQTALSLHTRTIDGGKNTTKISPSDVKTTISYVVKLHHKGTFRLLTLDGTRNLQFSFEQLENRIGGLFKIPSSALMVLEYFDLEGDRIILSEDADLKDALVRQALNPLRIDVAISEGDIDTSTSSEDGKNTLSYGVVVMHKGAERLLTLFPADLELWYEQLERRIRDIYNLQSTARFELGYEDLSGNTTTISNLEELKDAMLRAEEDALPLHMTMIEGDVDEKIDSPINHSNPPFVVKIMHNGDLRRLTLAPDDRVLSLEDFRSRIRDRFNLPASAQFVLSYIDEDQEIITMASDEELQHAMTLQSLGPLEANLKVVEGHNADVNMTSSTVGN